MAAADEVIEVLPRWKVGDKVRYDIAKSRRQTKVDAAATGDGARGEFEIEVLRRDDDGFLIAWTYGEWKFDDPTQAGNAFAQKFTNLLKGFRLVIELDDQASVQGLQNWEELQVQVDKTFAFMREELLAGGMQPAAVDKMFAEVKKIYGSQAQIENSVLRDPQLFLAALGVDLSSTEPTDYEDTLPNPFGGEPFPATGRFELKAQDQRSGFTEIAWSQKLEPEATRRIMEATIRAMSARLGKPLPNGEGLKSFQIDDEAAYRIETATGWIESLTHRRTIKAEDGGRVDELKIARKRN